MLGNVFLGTCTRFARARVSIVALHFPSSIPSLLDARSSLLEGTGLGAVIVDPLIRYASIIILCPSNFTLYRNMMFSV